MENMSDKDSLKKKKRRKRKKSTVVKSTPKKAEQIVKEHKTEEFNTAELEVIKTEVSKEMGVSKSNPQHIFSIQNLFMTVLVTCLVVLVIVAGYLVGLFDSLNHLDNDVDFDATNSIEVAQNQTVAVGNAELIVPTGYVLVEDKDSLFKINDVIVGVTMEVDSIVSNSDLYSEKTINKYRKELVGDDYVVYGSYVYDDELGKYLVYSGVDAIGTECRVVYAPLKGNDIIKILVTSEFESLTDDIYISIAEMLKK